MPRAPAGGGLGHHNHQVVQNAVGDEGFLAVQQVMVSLADGRGLHRRQVAARVGLGHGHGGNQRAADQARQPAPLLRLCAEVGDIGHDHVGVNGKPNAGRIAAGQLLADDGVEAKIGRA